MSRGENQAAIVQRLTAVGLSERDINFWLLAEPGASTPDFDADNRSFANYWRAGARLLGILPAPEYRGEPERAAARFVQETTRNSKARFLRRHAEAVYDAVTEKRSRFVRVEE